MKKRILSMLLAALLCLALLPAGLLTGAALAAEEPDYTSEEVTEDSFERVMDLAYRLRDENSRPGTGGGFTWDSEGKKRSWTYYNGIMMDAFLMLDSANFESYVNTFYNNNVTSQGQVNSSGAADNYYRENELDSIPPTRALFDLLRSNSVSDAEKNNYKRMIDYVYSVMSRFEVIPGTNNNFRHKMNNANWETYQLALDGMYMAQPFFMELANALDDGTLTLEDFTSYTGSNSIPEDTDEIYSAVFDRMYWVGDNLYDDGNGLYNHAWGPDAGLNGQYWLRAVGWYAATLADVISMLPDNFAEERIMLIEIETRLFDGMIAHQDRDTGMWYNVINYGPELAGPESMNQLESSGSALMAYAMMRSYAEGFVGRSYGAAGLRAFNAIAALKLDEGGLHDVYLSSGVETTPEGYLSKPYVTNEAKGVGPLFMAAAWAKQAADLYNQPVAVPLCAVDGDTDEALPGVTAQVLDGDGALVAEWNSGTEALPVEGILPGVEYTIHVISAPAGYALPEDAVFSLNEETLQITLNGTPIDDDVIDIRLFKNHLSIVTEIIPEGGGTVTADPANPAAGELVTLTVEPASGCVLKSLTATDEAGNEIFLDDGQFSMPEGSVTVTATFEEAKYGISTVFTDGTGSVNIGENDYRVTVGGDEPEENEKGEYVAKPGDDVVLSFNTPAGYELAGVAGIYLDESQNECSLPMTQDATDPSSWSFTMPDGDTVLTVTFRKLPVYSITIEPSKKGVVTVQPVVSTDGTAYVGEKVYVTAYPEDGITLSRVYYSGEGHADVVIPQNDDGYSFIMPDYDVTIHADFEAYYMVHVDFGTGHEDYAIDNFAGKTLPFGDESQVFEVSGSVVSFQYVPEDGGGDHIYNAKSVAEELLNALSDRNDNGERLMGQIALHQIEYYFENYANAPYNAQSPEEAANGEYSEDSYREGVTFYALWAKPAKVTLTVTPPACGTIVQYQYKTGSYVWVQPGPQLSVTGADFRDYQFFYTNWELSEYGISGIDDGPLTMTGGNSYKAHCYLDIDWGYFLDSSTAEKAITVVDGTLVSCDTDGKIVISVPVEHSYDENGICTGCGASQSATPAFMVQSLRLSGEIGVNFFLDLSALTEEQRESGYMTFDVGTTVSGRRVDYDKDFLNQTGEYYGFTCYVNAIQMADTITATYHYTVDGEEQTIQKTYSVEDYIAARMANSSVSETEQALIKSIKDYGYYSQIYLSALRGWSLGGKYAKMTEPYASSYDTDSMITPLKDYEVTRNLVSEDIEKITFALVLDSSTSIYLYIKPAEGYTGSVSAAVDGTAAEAESLADGRYRVMTPGISAHKLGDNYTVTITTDNGTSTVRISAMSYAYACISNTSSTEDAKNSAAALYSYYKAADTFKKSN